MVIKNESHLISFIMFYFLNLNMLYQYCLFFLSRTLSKVSILELCGTKIYAQVERNSTNLGHFIFTPPPMIGASSKTRSKNCRKLRSVMISELGCFLKRFLSNFFLPFMCLNLKPEKVEKLLAILHSHCSSQLFQILKNIIWCPLGACSFITPNTPMRSKIAIFPEWLHLKLLFLLYFLVTLWKYVYPY